MVKLHGRIQVTYSGSYNGNSDRWTIEILLDGNCFVTDITRLIYHITTIRIMVVVVICIIMISPMVFG